MSSAICWRSGVDLNLGQNNDDNMNETNMIGIVGSSRITPDFLERAELTVRGILYRYNKSNTTIVSGGNKGRRGTDGIDDIAVRIAEKMGYPTIVYKPKNTFWSGYKERNLQIANASDKVYSIAMPMLNPADECYHCAIPNNHAKTAGCWTAKHCREHELVVLGSVRGVDL